MDAVFSLLPIRPGSTIASVRIAEWLSKELDIHLYDHAGIAEAGPIRNLFIVNGSTLYCKCLPEIAKAVEQADKVIWVQNDYTLPPPKDVSDAQSPFRRAFADRRLVPHYWTTCQENSKLTEGSRWINWNVLGYKEDAEQAGLESRDVIYYGAYRGSRSQQFQAMLSSFHEGLSISSTSDKFPSSVRVQPFRDGVLKNLARYGLGVYLQDAKSTDKLHSPATRFYEMLSVGLPMVFHPDCVSTLAKYDIDVRPYIFTSSTNAMNLINNRKQIQMMQREWQRPFEANLKRVVREAYAALNA